MTAAGDALVAVAPALAFLIVGVPLAALLDQLGFFDAVATELERRWPQLPVFALWLLAAATTVVLNLDTTVVLLTPLYVRMARRAEVDPLPLALVPLLLAAFASSVLPVSNLTTLIAVEQLDLGIGDVLANLALPSFVAIAVGWACYQRRHPSHLVAARSGGDAGRDAGDGAPGPGKAAAGEPVADAASERRALVVGLPIVGLVLVGVTLGPAVGAAPWLVVAVADLVLMAIVRTVPWRVVPLGTAAAVGALAALVGALLDPAALDPLRATSGPVAVAFVGAGGAVVANAINNIPATLVMVDGARTATPAVWSWLLGVNVGSVLVPIGALANLLWLRIVRVEGLVVDLRRYVRLVVGIALPALVAALAAQALQSAFTGR